MGVEIDGVTKSALITSMAMQLNRANSFLRDMSHIDPSGDTKHINAYQDYGWPVNLTFTHFYNQYDRNPICYAGVTRLPDRCWKSNPWLQVGEESHEETAEERAFRLFAERVDLWRVLRQADEYSRVGEYAGVILRIADDKRPNQPVDGRLTAGYNAIVELVPAFQGQLKLTDWDSDENSETYGQPLMYSYREYALPRRDGDDNAGYEQKAYDVHPDRVWIWSKDGKPHGRSPVKAVYNSLVNIQKLSGAGGQAYWKNCRQSPVFDMAQDANINQLAQSLGVDSADDVKGALAEEIADWQSGLDKSLITQGLNPTFPNIDLKDPEKFFEVELSQVAAGFATPTRILIGNQQGERASTEDEKAFNQTAASRAEYYCTPNIKRCVDWLQIRGAMPTGDWCVSWEDFTAPSAEQKRDFAKVLAEINEKQMRRNGAPTFSDNEIREAMGFEPINDPDELDPDEPDDEPPEPQANERRMVVNLKGSTRGR